jgi:PAS domain S-box-containing protein
MNDQTPTYQELLDTVQALRARVAELERTEAELKRTDKALRDSEERFRVALQGAPFIVWHQDRDLRFTWVYNTEPGFDAEMALGKTDTDFLAPHEAAQVMVIKRHVMETGVGMRDEVSVTVGEEMRTYDLAVEPLRDAAGAIVGITCATLNVTARKRAEDQLREYAERQQTLSRRLLEVQEAERRHLARELHDEIGQQLTGLRLQVKQLTAGADPAAALTLLDGLLARVRDLSSDLRPDLLDQLGLLPALEWLLRRYTGQTGVAVDFKHAGLGGRFRPEVETAAYRIVQEALTNVARHAGVSTATVRLWAEGDALCIQVEDRGAGFDAASVPGGDAGCGLSGMQERVTLLNGELTVDSTPGAGTHLAARLPLKEATEKEPNDDLHSPGR